jgi:hypothetical protein
MAQFVNKTIMMEEYLDGDEVDCDLVLFNGECTYGAVTGMRIGFAWVVQQSQQQSQVRTGQGSEPTHRPCLAPSGVCWLQPRASNNSRTGPA